MNIIMSGLTHNFLSKPYSYNKYNKAFKGSSPEHDEFISTKNKADNKTFWYKAGCIALALATAFIGIHDYKLHKKSKASQKALEESKAAAENTLQELEKNISKLKDELKQKNDEIKKLQEKPDSNKSGEFEKYDYISQKIRKARKEKQKMSQK